MIKSTAGYFQALVDVVEQMLDQSVPGWRNDIDKQAISSGSILSTHGTHPVEHFSLQRGF